MKISRNWLQTYFEQPLPDAEKLGDALTFHAFEIDGIEKVKTDSVLDVKITPNRGRDCLCHYGIAKELSAILKLQLSPSAPVEGVVSSGEVHLGMAGSNAPAFFDVKINTPLCSRYIAGYIKGVKVGPSPDWLRERLESIGQRSINNIVDATNYVMFDLGQPLHAFDAEKISGSIVVRHINKGEELELLRTTKEIKGGLTADWSRKIIQLEEIGALVIADDNGPIALAGVKGGESTSIGQETKNIIVESANFDGVAVRRASKIFGLRTDASQRFEQVISPELAAYGMQAVIKLILRIAGGEVQGFVDVYPKKQQEKKISISVGKINQILGVTFTGADVADVFQRLGFAYKEEYGLFEVVVPFERLDLEIPEDLVEEVGRIQGYDKVLPLGLPPFSKSIEVNGNFYATEKIRGFFVSKGFSEVFTSVFTDRGERVVLNKVDGVRPYLRENLNGGLREALTKNIRNKELLNLRQIRIFEIGTVWIHGKEQLDLGIAVEMIKKEKTAGQYLYELGQFLETPVPITESGNPSEILEMRIEDILVEIPWPLSINVSDIVKINEKADTHYTVFSRYPFIVRDVAFWSPENSDEKSIEQMIKKEAGELCIKISLFDTFQKGGKKSLAFRLIFQSFEKTLTDEEVNPSMEKVYARLKSEGFEIR